MKLLVVLCVNRTQRAHCRWLLAAVFLAFSSLTYAQTPLETVLLRANSLWKPNAPRCTDAKQRAFPSKIRSDGSCDDRDSVLFNALLCVSGEVDGCNAVRHSQDTASVLPAAGRWWRSPRIALDSALQTGDSFSHDHALGVLLQTAVNRSNLADREQFRSWLRWIEANAPCVVGNEPFCVRVWPRYCRDDTEGGCALRPGDLATFGRYMELIGEQPPKGVGGTMERLFVEMKPYVLPITYANAHMNNTGPSLHLVGVEVLLWRTVGGIENNILNAIAVRLAERQPHNPFFALLAGRPKNEVASLVLARCPKSAEAIAADKVEWMWERADSAPGVDDRTMLWDCVFMANMLARP
jgi:hypothetical protein